MRHLEDRRRCPHCGRDVNERPYMMSRNADENVMSARTIAWILVAVLATMVIGSVHW